MLNSSTSTTVRWPCSPRRASASAGNVRSGRTPTRRFERVKTPMQRPHPKMRIGSRSSHRQPSQTSSSLKLIPKRTLLVQPPSAARWTGTTLESNWIPVTALSSSVPLPDDQTKTDVAWKRLDDKPEMPRGYPTDPTDATGRDFPSVGKSCCEFSVSSDTSVRPTPVLPYYQSKLSSSRLLGPSTALGSSYRSFCSSYASQRLDQHLTQLDLLNAYSAGLAAAAGHCNGLRLAQPLASAVRLPAALACPSIAVLASESPRTGRAERRALPSGVQGRSTVAGNATERRCRHAADLNETLPAIDGTGFPSELLSLPVGDLYSRHPALQSVFPNHSSIRTVLVHRSISGGNIFQDERCRGRPTVAGLQLAAARGPTLRRRAAAGLLRRSSPTLQRTLGFRFHAVPSSG